jgi:glycosyltransferase involved in cell wall biosynthesis
MKIAVIGSKGLPANQGGIEHYCEELYPQIVAAGHTVDLYARSSYIQQPWFSVSYYQGVRIICVPSISLRGLDAFTNSAIAAIAATLKNYDVIHFHALGPALFSYIPHVFSPAKIMVTCQGLDWQRAKWGKQSSRIIRLGEKIGVKCAERVIVVSKALKTYFSQTYGIKPAYIPNGPGKYAASNPNFSYVKSLGLEPDKYILFLGRLVPEKRPELLISAFQMLSDTGWKLALVGGDSDTTEYIAQLHQIIDGNPDIILPGELKGSLLAEIVRGAGLFVLPSDLEGLPLVMLESMREGIPVLASDIPPHQQLIGRERGMTFKAGDRSDCARAIARAIEQPQTLATMARKAREHVEVHYTWHKIMTDHLALYSGEPIDNSSESSQLANTSLGKIES